MGVQVRGRKSQLKLMKPQIPTMRVAPKLTLDPLSPEEDAIRHKIMAAMSENHFNAANIPILNCLCTAIATSEFLAAEMATACDNNDIGTIEKLTQIQELNSKSISYLSTKLRLTPRSKHSIERSENLKALNSATRPWEVKR